MVVPLLILGTLTKLSFAVAATYRTRWWWIPGFAAAALGALASLHAEPMATAGRAAIMLGLGAILIARAARRSYFA